MSYARPRGINPQDRAPGEGECPVNDAYNRTERVYIPIITGDTKVYG